MERSQQKKNRNRKRHGKKRTEIERDIVRKEHK